MITALVQIKLPEPMATDKAQSVFAETAPKYREVKGLIRKYYLLSEDGETAGGVYTSGNHGKPQSSSIQMTGKRLLCKSMEPSHL